MPHDIEQRAEMVDDRFLMRRSLPAVDGCGNLNVTLADLTVIPF
jgi:hypothetical protein